MSNLKYAVTLYNRYDFLKMSLEVLNELAKQPIDKTTMQHTFDYLSDLDNIFDEIE